MVVILWSRFGTPLDPQSHGVKADGQPYLSGTEWEFLDAFHAATASEMPLLVVYRRTEEPTPPKFSDPDFDDKVQHFGGGRPSLSTSKKDRVFECDSCGVVLERDHNAALNIKRVGASTLSETV